MFANFTEETCTGTGDTIALAGATSGNIQFVKSFADGDLVAYVIVDSFGDNKVAGVGTYVSATDDITRNDTWSWDGTSVDNNPSINLPLSGGTHIIRCDVTARESKGVHVAVPAGKSIITGQNGSNTTITLDADIAYSVVFTLNNGLSINAIAFGVITAVVSSIARLGIYALDSTGRPHSLLVETANIDTSTTGLKTETFTTIYLPAGEYFATLIVSDAIGTNCANRRSFHPTSLGATNTGSYCGWNGYTRTTAVDWIALPAPSSISTFGISENHGVYIRMTVA